MRRRSWPRLLPAVAGLWAAGTPILAQTNVVAPVPNPPVAIGAAGAAARSQASIRPAASTVLSLAPSPLALAPVAVPFSFNAPARAEATGVGEARAPTAGAVATAKRTPTKEAGTGTLADSKTAPSLAQTRVSFQTGQAAEPTRAGSESREEAPSAQAGRIAAKRAALERALDELFDNRRQAHAKTPEAAAAAPEVSLAPIPGGEVLLARAAARGVSPATLASAFRGARTELEAMAGLDRLGLLEPGERASATDPFDRHFALLRVWHDASASEGPGVSRAFPVPALTATRDGVTYFVHAVAHGRLRPAGRGRVLALARRLEAEGRPLYSEQNFPAAYGYAWGMEMLDHAVARGVREIGVRPAAEAAGGPMRRLLARAVDLAVAPGSLLLPLPLLASSWADPLGWLALATAALVNLALLTSLLPWSRFVMRWRAERDYRRLGNADMLHHYRAYADLAQRASSGVEEAARVELPMPLKRDAPEGLREAISQVDARSRAMAEAAARHAAQTGAREVHLLVGLNHAQEVAWHLGSAERPRG